MSESFELTPSAAFVASHVSSGLWGFPACLLALALASSLYLLGSSRRSREIEHQIAVRTHMNERLSAEITIRREDLEVNGKSIMGVMMLAAECGTMINVRAEGPDAEEALQAIADLVASRFGERDA